MATKKVEKKYIVNEKREEIKIAIDVEYNKTESTAIKNYKELLGYKVITATSKEIEAELKEKDKKDKEKNKKISARDIKEPALIDFLEEKGYKEDIEEVKEKVGTKGNRPEGWNIGKTSSMITEIVNKYPDIVEWYTKNYSKYNK